MVDRLNRVKNAYVAKRRNVDIAVLVFVGGVVLNTRKSNAIIENNTIHITKGSTTFLLRGTRIRLLLLLLLLLLFMITESNDDV